MLEDRLKQLAHAAAKSDWREFSMRVPAEPDRDADLVLLEASKLIPRLRAEVDGLRANQKCAGLEGDETGSPCNTYRMLEAQYDERLRQAQSERDTAELISLAIDARCKALQEANAKLAGALDMIRETLNGASVQDLLLIINRALEKHHKAMQDEGIANAG